MSERDDRPLYQPERAQVAECVRLSLARCVDHVALVQAAHRRPLLLQVPDRNGPSGPCEQPIQLLPPPLLGDGQQLDVPSRLRKEVDAEEQMIRGIAARDVRPDRIERVVVEDEQAGHALPTLQTRRGVATSGTGNADTSR
jgi:hypothetical protein